MSASRDRVADAEECKQKGNESLQLNDYDKAINWYTEAIKLNESHVYYSNRSAAYLSKGFAESALKDANKAIDLKPDWPKGYSRKGAALHKLLQFDKSVEAYEKGLELDPENPGIKIGLEKVKQQRDEIDKTPGGSSMFSNLAQTVANNPKLREYLQDPNFVQMITEIQQNPNNMEKYMKDPRFMETVNAVVMNNPDVLKEHRDKERQRQAEIEERNRKMKEEKKKREEEEKKKREEDEFNAMSPEEQQEVLDKKKSYVLKDEGNKLYKEKKFDEAVSKYDEAIQLNPKEMSFYTNKAAVELERQQPDSLEKCIDLCEKAIQIGRKNYADYGTIAKAYARMGNAYYKHNKFNEAIDQYKKAQLEKKNPAVAKRLKMVEKKKKVADEQAYLDPEKAKEAKAAGNEKFKGGDFPEAIKLYSEAIKRDPETAVYYNNRAAAYMKLADFGRAMDDCKKAIELDPKYVKAFSRKGNIELFLKEYHKALDTFNKGLEIDPENAECKNGLDRTNYAIQQAQNMPVGDEEEERARRAMEDPEIRSILGDPIMKSVIQEMQVNPAAAGAHLKNPEIYSKISKLIAAGVLRSGKK
eukprot:snap_masked-scaffold_49-processed-gene-1.74-mRNA-1 protein AED:0.02 eAED:0.02 QI:0/-1/0/1/-1/1/1/0/584